MTQAADKIEALLENFGDDKLGKAATLGGVGALGYGIGTGGVQKGADAGNKIDSIVDTATHTSLSDIGNKIADTASNIVGD